MKIIFKLKILKLAWKYALCNEFENWIPKIFCFLELNLFKFTNLDLFIFNLDEFKCTNFHMLNILGFKI